MLEHIENKTVKVVIGDAIVEMTREEAAALSKKTYKFINFKPNKIETLMIGESIEVTVEASSQDWHVSADSGIVSIEKNDSGFAITPLKEGKTVIIAEGSDKAKNKLSITIEEPVKSEEAQQAQIVEDNKTTLELSETNVTLENGNKTYVSVKTDAKTFNISSTSSEVVEVSKSRGSKISLIGRSEGNETITITARAANKEEVSKDLIVNVIGDNISN